jgi:hypothetical protein
MCRAFSRFSVFCNFASDNSVPLFALFRLNYQLCLVLHVWITSPGNLYVIETWFYISGDVGNSAVCIIVANLHIIHKYCEFYITRLGQPDGISPSRMAEMLEVDKAGPIVRC